MCEAAGVEAAFPMLTRAVTEHSLALPPEQKLRRRQLRYFFKHALRGFLPEEILRKKKHGFGMPFGAWLMTHPALAALADDALAGLATRGYLRPAFIGELRDAMATGHVGYYGTMVWILTVLELWLRRHLPDARFG
jgi:asparagine synthase (glutamine-hydrolysing)